jgi:hypothetical protein
MDLNYWETVEIKGPFATFRLVVKRDEPCRSAL